MNATARRPVTAPQPQVSRTVRLLAIVAVAAVTALAWLAAEQASHRAVQTASQAFARASTVTVTLPAVQVVGRRDGADARRI